MCVSVNEEVVHGIPGERVLHDGDVVSIDCGAVVDGWTAVTTDGARAGHWEHTVATTRRGLWVLTALDGGEAELAARGVPFAPLD